MLRSLIPSAAHRPTLLQGMFLASALLSCFLVYHPGLTGSFIFDDWSNLASLGDYGTVESLQEAYWFVSSGFAGPSGRPLSLATFLLDSNTWPALSARPFKQTNILIHLINGLLLMLLARRISLRLGAENDQAAWVGLLSGALWMLHPFLVSTTLYVVQRMAMLAATFVLLGLILYLYGRDRLEEGRTTQGYFWMTFAIVVCGGMGVLSKENGALLPLLILVLDFVAPSRGTTRRPNRGLLRAWRALFLYVPVGLILYKLGESVPELLAGEAGRRDYTPYERLLTEAWILLDYLGALLIPRPFTSGLFQDNIHLSTSFLDPRTFFATIVIVLSLYFAIRYRSRIPTISLAILFYFAGHLLESTFINLELYFEHRNYLPAALLPLPIAWHLVRPGRLRAGQRVALAGSLLCVLAAFTLVRADYWGEPFQQAILWVKQNPESPRANNHLASLWLESGNTRAAMDHLQRSLQHDEDNLVANVMLFSTKCRIEHVEQDDISTMKKLLRTANASETVVRYQLEKTLAAIVGGSCPSLSLEIIGELLAAGHQNSAAGRSPDWRQTLLQQEGRLLLRQGKPRAAYRTFLMALRTVPTLPGILTNAGRLASAGYPRLALQLIEEAPRPARDHTNSTRREVAELFGLDRRSSVLSEIQRLQEILRSEAEASSRGSDKG